MPIRSTVALQRTAAVLACSIAASPAMSAADGGAAGPLAQRMNQLGSETLRQLTSNGRETVMVSSVGLGSALHLLSFGARGVAERTLLGGAKPAEQIEGLKKLQASLRAVNNDKIKLANASAVFVPKQAKPSRSFVAAASDAFEAPVKELDFASANTLKEINGWAEKASGGLIPHLIERLDPHARFVLANVVYFNGTWETAFDAARTAKAPFTRIDGTKREVAMMEATMAVEWAEFDRLAAVWLPYAGKEVAMLLVAPGDGQGPATVAEALKRVSLPDLIAAAEAKRAATAVAVRLPRLRVESNFDVTSVLARQGLQQALSKGSDYTGINADKKAGDDPLVVAHRAVLEVTEAGTKASAGTTVTTSRSLSQPPTLTADRPFALAILHRATGAILFAGYIADPGQATIE
jgi:serine protease inhibitor